MTQVDLSIVMPCLNEAQTLASCIAKARSYLEKSGCRGEIIVADNGSSERLGNHAQRPMAPGL
jgi:glycosyltransferase involved in cell wall biosynthesis